jgi:hypothetical protein
MKKCPYCGAENADDADMCFIDHTPLDKTTSVQTLPAAADADAGHSRIHFAWVSEEKIPVSLIILSYLYFLPAGIVLGLLISMATLGIYTTDFSVMVALWDWILAGLMLVIFFTCLSRGLRRCSRGWRMCTLVMIGLGALYQLWLLASSVLYVRNTPHETVLEFYLQCGLSMLILLWQYRVLTRPDIKDLFGVY